MMWTRELLAAMPSTIAPVPSGEPSSTTRISRQESWARTAGISRAILNRSLYVGTMTSARSGKAAPVTPPSGGQHEESKGERQPGDDFSSLVGSAGKDEIDNPAACGELDSDKAEISPPDCRRLLVHCRDPSRIVVLRNDQRGSGRGRFAKLDLNLTRLVMAHRGLHIRGCRQSCDSSRS